MKSFGNPAVNKSLWWGCLPAVTLATLLVTQGCGGNANVAYKGPDVPQEIRLPLMAHTIQVGAFSNINNAVRLSVKLQAQHLNAYHFRHPSGLYKVRFGNYPSKQAARNRAENLKVQGLIDEYYIVGPNDYPAKASRPDDRDQLRKEIVKTAKRFIGIPYQWGGQSHHTGFDCSGLTMVVYRLNGLQLPRSSKQQWHTGKPIKRRQLSKGDLVFFATSGGRRVTHVGIYTGGNRFLHAPGRGRKIRAASLSSDYFESRYLGARTYL
jgi:cell wall-associated NlpC family hydrolase